MATAEILQRVNVSGFLQWWVGELIALLPPRIRRVVVGRQQRLVLDMTGENVTALCHRGSSPQVLGRFAIAQLGAEEVANLRQQLGVAAGRCPDTTVRLPPDLALQKELTLPLAAEENLRQVLAFEMDRQTPFKADQVYFDYDVLTRDSAARRLRVRLATVPRKTLDTLLERLELVGIRPDRVDVTGNSAVNLLPAERRPVHSQGQRRVNSALGAAVVLLALASAVIPLWQQRELVLELRPRVAAAQSEAEQVMALRDKLERAVKESRVVLDKRRKTPLVIDVLNEVTRLLPDGTWLSSLELKGNELRIQGESTGASALVGVLEASPRFSQVHFSSPVTQNPATGRERFQLSATVDPYSQP
jgi:general secretion pathway protein L